MDLISRQRDDTLKIIADTISLYGTGTKVESEILSVVSKIPSAEPLTEEDYTELRDRFGEYVEFVVRDMIDGKGERWRKVKD